MPVTCSSLRTWAAILEEWKIPAKKLILNGVSLTNPTEMSNEFNNHIPPLVLNLRMKFL